MPTPSEFKFAARVHNIDHWELHNCTFCGYRCGFIFVNEKVYYDHGCYCSVKQKLRNSDWAEVADWFNIQTNETVLKNFNKFWGFIPKENNYARQA